MALARLFPPLLLALLFSTGCSHKPVDGGSPQTGIRAADAALTMIGKPYRYGGNTPNGFDCSGLVQYSYARAGLRLAHGTDNLRRQSQPVSHRNLRRGDLVFFDQEGKKSSHVGIYLGNDEFVHAPSTGKSVHVSKLADRYWQQHFAGARRVDVD